MDDFRKISSQSLKRSCMGHGGGRKHDATATDVIWILIACMFSCHSRVEPPQYYQYNATTHDLYGESLSYIILHPHFIPPNLDVWVQQTATHFQQKQTGENTHTHKGPHVRLSRKSGRTVLFLSWRKKIFIDGSWMTLLDLGTGKTNRQLLVSSDAFQAPKRRRTASMKLTALKIHWFCSPWWPIISSPWEKSYANQMS